MYSLSTGARWGTFSIRASAVGPMTESIPFPTMRASPGTHAMIAVFDVSLICVAGPAEVDSRLSDAFRVEPPLVRLPRVAIAR